jgi:hypothetical protein
VQVVCLLFSIPRVLDNLFAFSARRFFDLFPLDIKLIYKYRLATTAEFQHSL